MRAEQTNGPALGASVLPGETVQKKINSKRPDWVEISAKKKNKAGTRE